MSAELAQSESRQTSLCGTPQESGIRLHPSKEPVCGIASKNLCRMLPCQEKRPLFFLIYVANYCIHNIFD